MIPNLKDFRKLLKREASAHKSGPFCHGGRHLMPVGDPPLCPIPQQRDPALLTDGPPRAFAAHHGHAPAGFVLLDSVILAGFHLEKIMPEFHFGQVLRLASDQNQQSRKLFLMWVKPRSYSWRFNGGLNPCLY